MLAWAMIGAVLAGEGEAPPPPSPMDEVPVPPPISEEEIETIVVISDPFARWNGTRWFIKTEMGLPISMTFLAEENWEFRVAALQVRTLLACDKDEKLGRRKYEVHCVVEDIGIQAADESGLRTPAELRAAERRAAAREARGKDPISESQERRREHIAQILDEVDQKLTGASLQLQVNAYGRVTNIDLEGIPSGTPRELAMSETLSKLMSRVIVGFDMKLENYDFLEKGIWVESTSALMSIPIEGVATQGNSMLIHRLSTIEGNLIVESRGKGVISFSYEDMDLTRVNFLTTFSGVAAYDADDAYMTERVWTLQGNPSADAWVQWPYWHSGRIIRLKPEQKPSVGPTRLVTLPCCPADGLPGWQPLED